MIRWKPAAIAVLVVVLLAVANYFLEIVRIGGHVAMPASSASPTQVVRSYIDALNRHDCSTAVALWTTPATPSSWCDNVSSISATILGVRSEANPRTQSGVDVQISVHWRPFHDDGTLPPTFGWTYLMTRLPAGWRIYDNGQG